MKCSLCETNKLSREFPRETITEKCDHPPYYCLRCVTKTATESSRCPCGKEVQPDNERLKEFEALLNFLFPPFEVHPEKPPEHDTTQLHPNTVFSNDQQLTVYVARLTGDTTELQVSSTTTVAEFKEKIKLKLKEENVIVETFQQRLVYREQEFKLLKSDGKDCTLKDYDVKQFATIQLMIVLCNMPENHIIFDLSWGYPIGTDGKPYRDFLDASCYLFMHDDWYSFVDWRATGHLEDQVWHSGDNMDDVKKIGSHRIEAKLKNIPKCVSHLVFFLSSFKSLSINNFPKPTLRFYDASDPKKELAHATYTNQLNSCGLLVCCVSRMEGSAEKWIAYEGGITSTGNAKIQSPFKGTFMDLLQKKIFPNVHLETGKSRITIMNAEQQKEFNLRCERRLN